MSTILRVEFPSAYSHVTSRGNARSDIYMNDEARRYFLTLLQQACERFRGFCHAYCLMERFRCLVLNPIRVCIWEMGELTPNVPLSRNQLTGDHKFIDEIERITGLRIEKRGQGRPRKERRNEKYICPVF